MRPIARVAARQHVFVEAVIGAYAHGVGRAPLQVRRDVQRERRIAFAQVRAGRPAVHPNGGGVEHGLEFQPHDGAGPFQRHIEDALVPSHAVEGGALRGSLPGVRDHYALPVGIGLRAEIPKAVERDASIDGGTGGCSAGGPAQSGSGNCQRQAIEEDAAGGHQRSRNHHAERVSKGSTALQLTGLTSAGPPPLEGPGSFALMPGTAAV